MIIDTVLHQFTEEQLKLSNRGSTDILPCQMYVLQSSYISMNDMIQKQYKLLEHYLSIVFAMYNVTRARSMFINKEIKNAYTNTISIP
ncbi:unnamed protein product [Rotaria sordida]|uniref:Uncharacterized protein n=1 Tax=Rotaria sordida TaxID=392033 RepID=A0A819FSC2_9BILA|nr:unnamed protein product [Rotaria sordida]CAF1205780.1 unnamed protein product [Rotaria sordida]CAF3682473.1 unnamed protein product [Rotaria sordida]CAF3870752.1 unnamed protein product [Rotaria sordida]